MMRRIHDSPEGESGSTQGDDPAAWMTKLSFADSISSSFAIQRPLAASRRVLHCSSAGLCNRLRAVLSHHLVATESSCLLTVVWAPSQQCPGTFTELFEPLPGVEFVAARGAAEDACTGGVVVEANDYHESIKGRPALIERCWAALTLLPALCDEVDANVAACGGAFIAVHVRRTDHAALYEPLIVTMACEVTDAELERFCDAHAALPVFVATDCHETQHRLCARYPARCRVGRHSIGMCGGSDVGRSVPSFDTLRQPSLRQTSLRASAVDLFTCVEATIFKGSPFSSFSDAICHLRAVHGATHVADEHTAELAPTDTPQWRETIVASAHAQAARGNPTLMRILQDVGVPLDVPEYIVG